MACVAQNGKELGVVGQDMLVALGGHGRVQVREGLLLGKGEQSSHTVQLMPVLITHMDIQLCLGEVGLVGEEPPEESRPHLLDIGVYVYIWLSLLLDIDSEFAVVQFGVVQVQDGLVAVFQRLELHEHFHEFLVLGRGLPNLLEVDNAAVLAQELHDLVHLEVGAEVLYDDCPAFVDVVDLVGFLELDAFHDGLGVAGDLGGLEVLLALVGVGGPLLPLVLLLRPLLLVLLLDEFLQTLVLSPVDCLLLLLRLLSVLHF